jgi:hypothetical protein
VIFTEGDLWREQRRFVLHQLREFGLGKNLMQERVGKVIILYQNLHFKLNLKNYNTTYKEINNKKIYYHRYWAKYTLFVSESTDTLGRGRR